MKLFAASSASRRNVAAVMDRSVPALASPRVSAPARPSALPPPSCRGGGSSDTRFISRMRTRSPGDGHIGALRRVWGTGWVCAALRPRVANRQSSGRSLKLYRAESPARRLAATKPASAACATRSARASASADAAPCPAGIPAAASAGRGGCSRDRLVLRIRQAEGPARRSQCSARRERRDARNE